MSAVRPQVAVRDTLAVGDDFQLLFNWLVFSRLIQVRSGPPGAQKENFWGLLKLQDSLYGLDVLPSPNQQCHNYLLYTPACQIVHLLTGYNDCLICTPDNNCHFS